MTLREYLENELSQGRMVKGTEIMDPDGDDNSNESAYYNIETGLGCVIGHTCRHTGISTKVIERHLVVGTGGAHETGQLAAIVANDEGRFADAIDLVCTAWKEYTGGPE